MKPEISRVPEPKDTDYAKVEILLAQKARGLFTPRDRALVRLNDAANASDNVVHAFAGAPQFRRTATTEDFTSKKTLIVPFKFPGPDDQAAVGEMVIRSFFLLSAVDEDVFLALVFVTGKLGASKPDDKGCLRRSVIVSRNELLHFLGWECRQRDIQRLKECLNRLAAVTVTIGETRDQLLSTTAADSTDGQSYLWISLSEIGTSVFRDANQGQFAKVYLADRRRLTKSKAGDIAKCLHSYLSAFNGIIRFRLNTLVEGVWGERPIEGRMSTRDSQRRAGIKAALDRFKDDLGWHYELNGEMVTIRQTDRFTVSEAAA